jgi:hypothetical protein
MMDDVGDESGRGLSEGLLVSLFQCTGMIFIFVSDLCHSFQLMASGG